MAKENGNGHLALSFKLIGIFVAIIFFVSGWLVASQRGEVASLERADQEAAEACGGTMNEHDTRIRDVEQSNAAVQERLDGIQRTLDRIERQLEKGAPR